MEWAGLEFGNVPEGRGERRKMEGTGCEVNCGAISTTAVKG